MRLVAIFCVWDDWDLLSHSVKNIEPLVDGVIIVASHKSNYGEKSEIPLEWMNKVVIHEPQAGKLARENETAKRNHGLELAKKAGYTHFLTMDADEFYEPEPFLKAKERFQPNLKGLVCNCQTYFKSPQLTIGLDTTLVPFIHKLSDNIHHGFNKAYPFAWVDGKIRIDPTRSLNIYDGVERIDLVMHHYSWVRKDYKKKIRNSTARANLERSTILNDLVEAKEGGFCEYYQKTLVRASVDFEIPEYVDNESSNPAVRKDL